MRLFIYELLSAGALIDDPPASLRAEGWAMLSAIVDDFQRAAGVEVLTLLDADNPATLGDRCIRCRPSDEAAAFRRLAGEADQALVIAPECDDLLAIRSQRALDAGAGLLGCAPDDIRRVADKLHLAAILQARSVATPRTRMLGDDLADMPFPRVLKPRVGAGAQATWIVRGADRWDAAVQAAQAELPGADFTVQPYHPGTPASMALLCGRGRTLPTPGAYQRLATDGRVAYEGGSAPLPAPLRARAERLALSARAACGPLQGYVGVDIVLGAADDGSQDVVIEVNPRLTTSYIGLRRLTDANLAEHWLRLLDPEREDAAQDDAAQADIAWRSGSVRFTPQGVISG